MAKQVEDIVVRLVGEGFEALDKIKGSFRELGKVTNLAEKDILSARDSLLDYARKAGNTEAVNKGLGDAFKGLRSQVDLCSDAYRVLSADLRQIDEVSRGATQSVMAQRQAVLASTAAGTQNVAALQQQRAALIALRAQTRDASTAFDQFSADIQAVETRLNNLADVNRRFNAVLVQGTAATAAGARVQLEALTDGIALRRQDLADIDRRSARERNLRATIEQRLAVEQRLNTALSMRRRIQFQEGARTGREGARTGAATFNDPTVTAGFLAPDRIAQRIGDLPNTTAGLSQELGELNERLINTYRNTEIYTAVQLRLAAVQREVAAATQGFGAALRAQLDAGTLIPSQKNLAEVIGQLRREMLELDTTTTAGAQAYANNARQADQLDRQLRELAGAYRQVGSMATVAATAEQNAANARIRGNYLNRGAVRQQEQALRELGGRVQQGVAGTPLLLPAAGQTSAAGTGAAMSGGARRLTGQVETTFGAGVDARGYSPRSTFQQQFLPTAAVGTAPSVGFAAGAAQAFDNLGRSTDRARRPLRDIFAELERVRGASNGSVNSLQAQISAWTQIRSAVSSSAPVFATATKQIEALSRQQARLQVGGGRRLTGSQLAQGAGAALSGGIFGGPEGLIGGLGGLAFGGVGGAFAGAAAGAQVGMFRQQLGGTAEYAASIGKLQIALRGVVGSQEAYDAAIRAAAAATRDLNIPQEEATRGLTRLSAAVIGAGGTVADSSFAFRAMSEAIKATGGNAEQVDGALLALTQVFSKGKVSAEELNQIAERLPGTFTLFAQAAGKTGPELQKALEQGQVGLNDLMKFLELTGDRYGKIALDISGSSQDAGARLTVAFQAMRLEVGKALQPLGAELQGAFAAFIKDITPAVVGSAKAIAEVLSFLTTNDLVAFGVQLTAVSLGFKGLQVAAAALTSLNVASWFTATAVGAKVTSSGMAAATVTTGGLTGAIKALTLAMAKNPLTLLILAGTAAAIAIGNAVIEQKKLNDEVQKSLDIAAKAPASDVAKEINATENALRKERSKIADALKNPGFEAARFIPNAEVERLEAKLLKLSKIYKVRIELETIFKGLGAIPEGYKVVNGRLAYLSPGQGYIDAETGKPVAKGRSNFPGGGGEDGGEKAGASLLQAIEQRETALLNLRTQREEQLAQIREQAVEQARQIETQLADKRLAIERQVQDIKRQSSDFIEDSERRIRAASGESPDRIADEQRIADIFREERDSKIDSERRLADDKQEQERTIAEFQRGVAKSINDANRAHTKSMGEIQKQYANSVAKIIDEGTGKAGKRLEKAAQLAAAYVQRGTANSQIAAVTSGIIPERKQGVYDFRQVGGTGATTPAKLLNTPGFEDVQGPLKTIIKLDDTIERLRKELELSRTPVRTPGIGGQFTALLGAEGASLFGTGFDVSKIATDFGQIASASFIGGLLAQNSPIPESQKLRDSQGRELNRGQPTAYPLPVIPSAEPTTQLRDAQAQEEQGAAGVKTAQQIKEAFAGVNAESAQFTNGLNEQLGLLGSQRKFLDMGFSDALSSDLANLDRALAASTVRLNDIAADLKSRGSDPATVDAQKKAAITRAQELYAINVKLTQELDKQLQDPGAKIRAFINDAQRELNDLGSVAIRISQGIGDAVGNSLASGLSGLIEGTASAKQVFGNFLRDIGQLLIKEGTKMIATYIAIGIAKMFAGMGNSIAPGPVATSAGVVQKPGFFGPGFANGGTFAKNGIVPYAKGGTFSNSVVSSPTLFKFAAGGTTRTGLMGEAGPEAIMPLKRGFDGKLGVAQVSTPSGGDTRMRDMMGRSPAQQATPVLNMSFQSTTINGVEYVSRDQLEAAMAQTRRQAAKEGANRGMNMTLDKIQNSPSTRSRVGIR